MKKMSAIKSHVRPPRGRGTGMRRLGAVLMASLALALLQSHPAQAEYGDVILNNWSQKNGMRPVIFPHWFHRERFRCKVCHTELGFKMQAGGDNINMADIINGKYCGACHNGKIAWSVEHCGLCHSGKPGLTTGIKSGGKSQGPGIL
jgi:c(7)-type cytochrome triheme protein